MKKHKPPFKLKELKIEVTHDCQLQCVHCSSMAETDSQRVMAWRDCEKIINEAAEMGVTQMAFSGGEPLLWEHLPIAVSLAYSHGMRIFLYTTGNAPGANQKLEELKSHGLSRIMFSIFGTEHMEHDTVTRITGSFNQSLQTVRFCIQIGLEVEFHFVPLSDNYQRLTSIAALAKDIGVSRISILRLVPQGRAALRNNQLLTHDQNSMSLR